MRWQAILLGVVASWSGAAHADCDGIEMVTYGDPAEVSCHRGSELFLPWVDWLSPRFGVDRLAPRIETIPSRFHSSITVFDAFTLEALGAQDISDLTRIDFWYDTPELDER